MSCHEGAGSETGSIHRATGIEAKPADPEQAGPDSAEKQMVGLHAFVAKADALAEVERANKRAYTRGNVNDGAARKIETGNAAAKESKAGRTRPAQKSARPGPVIIRTSAALVSIQALSPASCADLTADSSAADTGIVYRRGSTHERTTS